jgi:hypothetical protein
MPLTQKHTVNIEGEGIESEDVPKINYRRKSLLQLMDNDSSKIYSYHEMKKESEESRFH